MEAIEIILLELKQQHSWRKEEGECGLCEVEESWDMLKYDLSNKIKNLPADNSNLLKLIEST